MMSFIGTARFDTHPGVTVDQMIKAERGIREALGEQVGFPKRTLGRFPDGQWLVTIRWDSAEHGSRWTEASRRYESVTSQHALIDFDTMRMEFYEEFDLR
ncbi:MAG: hypothetical protein R2731_01095 [Nocardioides sp.]